MSELENLRQEIDRVDRALASLFEDRMDLTAQVGAYKLKHNLPVLDPAREAAVLAAKQSLLRDPARSGEMTAFFQAIMALSRRQQQDLLSGSTSAHCARDVFAHPRTPVLSPRVLYQGEPGAYAEEAAAAFFGEGSRRDKARTWEEIFVSLQNGQGDYGVLPMENSSSGGISQVYDLLSQYGGYIVGEVTLKVTHCLMAPHGATLDTLSAVYSHQQGLLQSTAFLDEHPAWTRNPRLNTAEAAKFVAECGDVTRAAIGSRRAAQIYGLDVLAEGINFNKNNHTRFVVVSPLPELRPGSDKISAVFTLPHQSGSLYGLMTIFAAHGLNMLKLESRPIIGKSWEYRFFIDFSGALTHPDMDGVLEELEKASTEMRVLGNYPGGTAG